MCPYLEEFTEQKSEHAIQMFVSFCWRIGVSLISFLFRKNHFRNNISTNPTSGCNWGEEFCLSLRTKSSVSEVKVRIVLLTFPSKDSVFSPCSSESSPSNRVPLADSNITTLLTADYYLLIHLSFPECNLLFTFPVALPLSRSACGVLLPLNVWFALTRFIMLVFFSFFSCKWRAVAHAAPHRGVFFFRLLCCSCVCEWTVQRRHVKASPQRAGRCFSVRERPQPSFALRVALRCVSSGAVCVCVCQMQTWSTKEACSVLWLFCQTFAPVLILLCYPTKAQR